MNTRIIALLVIALGIAAYLYVKASPTPHANAPVDETHAEESHTEEAHDADAPEGMSMDEHKKLMDDGETWMAMGNEISPALLHASPGQELTFASHENFPIELKTADGAYATPLANPGDAHSTFKAPMKPGRYEFVSSHDATVKAVLIVEE